MSGLVVLVCALALILDYCSISLPRSLPNLATNAADTRCGNAATQAAYIGGIRYAISTLARRAPHANLYLDAGHGGWLGWPDKVDDFLHIISRLGAGAVAGLRGLATNVANYQSLGVPCPASAFATGWPQLGPQYCAHHADAICCRDPCGLLSKYNSANNELNYVQLFTSRLRRSATVSGALPNPRFIIDTGRNGNAAMRTDCSNWCNIRGAAVGVASTPETALPDHVDAYFWLKTPGESDGCTEILPSGERCPRVRFRGRPRLPGCAVPMAPSTPCPHSLLRHTEPTAWLAKCEA